jgi:hypothetical protein
MINGGSMSPKLNLVWIIFALCLVIGGTAGRAEDKKKDSSELKKYIGLYTRTQPKAQLILQGPKIREMAGRTFLVGTPVEYIPQRTNPELRPFKNAVRWVAWEEIIEFYEFDTINGVMADPIK